MKKALITGSSRGIGAAAAMELARHGYKVFINYLNSESKAFELAAELGAEAIRADVSDPEQVRSMFKITGGVDVLVCNAGVASAGLFQDISDEEWQRLFSVNINGVFYCCREAVPHMISQKSGSIITLASILGTNGGSCEAAYSATKGAVIAFTKALAKELGPSGIRVNSVAPGAIDTDMLAPLSVQDKADIASATALCRLGNAADVGKVIAFLASDESRFVTGQIIGVDGGLII